jgi:hypothetical protein
MELALSQRLCCQTQGEPRVCVSCDRCDAEQSLCKLFCCVIEMRCGWQTYADCCRAGQEGAAPEIAAVLAPDATAAEAATIDQQVLAAGQPPAPQGSDQQALAPNGPPHMPARLPAASAPDACSPNRSGTQSRKSAAAKQHSVPFARTHAPGPANVHEAQSKPRATKLLTVSEAQVQRGLNLHACGASAPKQQARTMPRSGAAGRPSRRRSAGKRPSDRSGAKLQPAQVVSCANKDAAAPTERRMEVSREKHRTSSGARQVAAATQTATPHHQISSRQPLAPVNGRGAQNAPNVTASKLPVQHADGNVSMAPQMVAPATFTRTPQPASELAGDQVHQIKKRGNRVVAPKPSVILPVLAATCKLAQQHEHVQSHSRADAVAAAHTAEPSSGNQEQQRQQSALIARQGVERQQLHEQTGAAPASTAVAQAAAAPAKTAPSGMTQSSGPCDECNADDAASSGRPQASGTQAQEQPVQTLHHTSTCVPPPQPQTPCTLRAGTDPAPQAQASQNQVKAVSYEAPKELAHAGKGCHARRPAAQSSAKDQSLHALVNGAATRSQAGRVEQMQAPAQAAPAPNAGPSATQARNKSCAGAAPSSAEQPVQPLPGQLQRAADVFVKGAGKPAAKRKRAVAVPPALPPAPPAAAGAACSLRRDASLQHECGPEASQQNSLLPRLRLSPDALAAAAAHRQRYCSAACSKAPALASKAPLQSDTAKRKEVPACSQTDAPASRACGMMAPDQRVGAAKGTDAGRAAQDNVGMRAVHSAGPGTTSAPQAAAVPPSAAANSPACPAVAQECAASPPAPHCLHARDRSPSAISEVQQMRVKHGALICQSPLVAEDVARGDDNRAAVLNLTDSPERSAPQSPPALVLASAAGACQSKAGADHSMQAGTGCAPPVAHDQQAITRKAAASEHARDAQLHSSGTVVRAAPVANNTQPSTVASELGAHHAEANISTPRGLKQFRNSQDTPGSTPLLLPDISTPLVTPSPKWPWQRARQRRLVCPQHDKLARPPSLHQCQSLSCTCPSDCRLCAVLLLPCLHLVLQDVQA